LDVLFKPYWILNANHHLYFNIGNNFEKSSLSTIEAQSMSDGKINDFAPGGFGNDIDYRLNDAIAGIEYKFRLGKWTNRPALFLHRYDLRTRQPGDLNSVSFNVLQPRIISEYDFNNSENLYFSYELGNAFAGIEKFAGRFTLLDYNLVFRGNPNLSNERFHSGVLRYTKFSSFRGIQLNAGISLLKKEKSIQNVVALDGINQFSTVFLTNNPETTWRINFGFSKKVQKLNFRLNVLTNWFSYVQNLNGVAARYDRNSQNIRITAKTAHKSLPDVSLTYGKSFSRFDGPSTARFTSDAIDAYCSVPFFRNWVAAADFSYLRNKNASGSKNDFLTTSASLRYQKKDSPFIFECSAQNIFNNRHKNMYSFSDYIVSEQNIKVLPRAALLSIMYKL